MRIVQIVANLDIGGLERQVIDLARLQKAAGHDARIYCLFHAGVLAAEAAGSAIPVVAFQKPRGLSLRTFSRMARQLRDDRPDIVHTHNAVVHHYGVVAAKVAGVRAVVNTQHGTETLACDPKLSRIFRFTMPWTERVVMVAESVGNDLTNKHAIDAHKTQVIPNGIPLAKFESYQARPGGCLPRIRFGTVGRLMPAKDHRSLLTAFGLVVQELPPAELHIAGDGPLRESLQEQVFTLGLADKIHLHGARSDIPQFLSSLDIFVLSSVTEGLPVASLEAMAAGLPIVSTRAGGAAEIASASITEFCPPSQPTALAAAMLRMARCADLASRGEAARRLARSHGIDQTWLQYQELFRTLLSGESSPGIRRQPVLNSQ